MHASRTHAGPELFHRCKLARLNRAEELTWLALFSCCALFSVTWGAGKVCLLAVESHGECPAFDTYNCC